MLDRNIWFQKYNSDGHVFEEILETSTIIFGSFPQTEPNLDMENFQNPDFILSALSKRIKRQRILFY
jgi:hypothetical protein